ncbi:MAG: acyltransferase, partial [Spirochaetota bacterium]
MLNIDAKRLRSLDILRGLAILMVFASHVDPRTSEVIAQLSGLGSFAFWFFHRLGRTGVELFFILSGFLIGGLLFRETSGTGRIDIWRFWIRRGFKIWPSYWLLLLVLALTRTTGYIDTRSIGTALQSAAMHLFFLQNYLPDNPNGPTWSLAVEEHFYLFLPLLLGAVLAFARWRKTDWRRYVCRVTIAVVLVYLAFRIANLRSGI